MLWFMAVVIAGVLWTGGCMYCMFRIEQHCYSKLGIEENFRLVHLFFFTWFMLLSWPLVVAGYYYHRRWVAKAIQ